MTITVTEDGQITLTRQVVAQLGFTPEQELTVSVLPQGGAALHAIANPPRWTPEEMARIAAVIDSWKGAGQASPAEEKEAIATIRAILLNNEDE